MSYLVMETKRSYAVLLDQEGRFLKAANLHYQVGQTVTDPVLLREKSEKGRLILLFAGGGAALAAVAACLVFAVILPLYQQATSVYSSIYMTINPQVRMELNKAGDVIGLAPTNGDGETLLQGYELSEDDPTDVADDLLDRAIALGFLEEGGTVNFSIDTPEEALFQEYGMELRQEVEDHLEGKLSVVVEVVPYVAEDVSKTFNDYQEDNDVDFIKVHIADGHPWIGKSLAELALPHNLLAVMIARDGRNLVPDGQTVLADGDLLVFAARAFEDRENLSLREVPIDKGHKWNGRSLREISTPQQTLVILIQRGAHTMIPDGGTRIQTGDVLVLAQPGKP